MKNINLVQIDGRTWRVTALDSGGMHRIVFKNDWYTCLRFIGQNVFHTFKRFMVRVTGTHKGVVYDGDWMVVYPNGRMEKIFK